jgi:hypothetical protein
MRGGEREEARRNPNPQMLERGRRRRHTSPAPPPSEPACVQGERERRPVHVTVQVGLKNDRFKSLLQKKPCHGPRTLANVLIRLQL